MTTMTETLVHDHQRALLAEACRQRPGNLLARRERLVHRADRAVARLRRVTVHLG